jgi:hypothetical protein
MKVFIKGVLTTPEDTPIVLVLDEADKRNIAAMPPDHYRYGCFLAEHRLDECQKIMDDLSALIGPPASKSTPITS